MCDTLDVTWAPGPPSALLRLDAIVVKLKVFTVSLSCPFQMRVSISFVSRPHLPLLNAVGRCPLCSVPFFSSSDSSNVSSSVVSATQCVEDFGNSTGASGVEVLELITADLILRTHGAAPAGTTEEYDSADPAELQVGGCVRARALVRMQGFSFCSV